MNPLKLQWEDVAAIFSTSPLFIPDPGGSHIDSIQFIWVSGTTGLYPRVKESLYGQSDC